ncbi:uncharacterized protein PHACADRAFT_103842 [Phanerochaete carnosa HHB-10118-sp]|uniref:Cytochrome P450 n=1 Tax=Phanerochaete carnosa (strain HHB-10118-sp) TaxID=650164 RepID=K5UMK4_PHACS|nr:uncharacterized protein PHACADRAFT_103842 [Phanerochaete carnosa HHB-10118-sp]EKM50921.1 hypothetical protein PHACADRAFT_103842 [Phanerochaete carnosa HHB-10118-sp]
MFGVQGIALFGLVALFAVLAWRHSRRLPLPPASTSSGDSHIQPWRAYAEHSKTLGPLLTVSSLGRQVLVINTVEAVTELLDKRKNFACRPRWPMADLLGRQKNVGFQYYGERLKQSRKVLHSSLNANVIRTTWNGILGEYSSKLMLRFLESPETFYEDVHRCIDLLIVRFAYGREPDAEHLQLAKSAMQDTNEALQPGRWLVDTIPALAYVPSWFPGASYMRWARSAREKYQMLTQTPFLRVKCDLQFNGDAPLSFARHALETSAGTAEDEDVIMSAAGSLYSGMCTTSKNSAVLNAILLLTLHPEVQSRAYAELLAAVGSDRLPETQDMNYLPYMNCVIQECHRFSPAVPLVTHSNIDEDSYLGYRIPKKTWIMANVWAMLHNEKEYGHPSDFNPDRFAPEKGKPVPRDPRTVLYGFGRRVCPGLHFANHFIFLVISRLIACFELHPQELEGKTMRPPLQYTTALIS